MLKAFSSKSARKRAAKLVVSSFCALFLTFQPLIAFAQVAADKSNQPQAVGENVDNKTGNGQVQSAAVNRSATVQSVAGRLATAESTPYQKTFVISAYYSPVANQTKYVTGSFDGDVRLNGEGVHSADGSLVYPGMVAAPKTYAFGTKMKISGVGVVAVHDRGGAIVRAGELRQPYDRLDVWMGYGDNGLQRALNWGRRTAEVTVYGLDPEIKEAVSLEGYSEAEKSLQSLQQEPQLFSNDLSLGSEGENVAKMQDALKNLGYLQDAVSKKFDDHTRDALILFQIDAEIVDSKADFGAGYFGPQTRQLLQDALRKNQKQPGSSSGATVQLTAISESTPTLATFSLKPANTFNRDLGPGDRGSDVMRLQQELKRLNLLGVQTSGYFGAVTEHAVMKLQQNLKVIADPEAVGAGHFGVLTRTHLNTLVAKRELTERLIADKKRNELHEEVAYAPKKLDSRKKAAI